MERLFHSSRTVDSNQLPVHKVAAKNATCANDGRRSSTKTTAYDEQDYDLSYAYNPWFLRNYVQRRIRNLLFCQQLYDNDNVDYFQSNNEKCRQKKSKITLF